jgi:hypothetical protein
MTGSYQYNTLRDQDTRARSDQIEAAQRRSLLVIPAKASTHAARKPLVSWIPAFAGMTGVEVRFKLIGNFSKFAENPSFAAFFRHRRA